MLNQNISQNSFLLHQDSPSSNMLFPDMLEQVVSSNTSASKTALIKKLDPEQQPRTIEAAHFKQWVEESRVSEEITRLNIYSVSDKKEIAKLLGWRKYDHSPGWWCSGVNPYTGKRLTNGVGQFRPDEKWIDVKTGDLAKYLTSKSGYDALCLDTGNPEYWSNIINDVKIPLFITEGTKKAGSGISHGYPTIALLGVWMGVFNVGTPQKKKYKLVPTLRMFCQPGRVFNLCFDADIARKKEVREALRFLVKLLQEEGCIVKIVSWKEIMGKGMDDYLANNGKEAFDTEINRAQLIEEWEEQFEDDFSDEEQTLPKHSGMSLILKPRINNLRFNDTIHQWEEYDSGHWSIASNESVIQRVTDQIEELYPKVEFDSSYPTGVSQSLISRVLQKNLPEPPRHLLPFKNGVLDLETKLILPHSPEYNFNNIIDREHDLDAKDWSLISEWMDFVFYGNSEQKRLLCFWYAAVLRGLWELHRFAVFQGVGGTGKSTAMKLGSDLVGKRSSHSLTLEALNTNSFQTGNIYDKRLICVNDADRYHGNLGIFKNITGGDEINVEWKFQKAFNAVYHGLVMLSANNPVFTMNDSGIDRRMILFKFDRVVENIDKSFDKKLKSQMSAFTNYLLGIPEDEIIEALLYKVDSSGVRIQNELDALLQTNGVAEWLNNRYVYDPNGQVQIGNDKTQTDQLYGDYCDYTSKSGSSPMSAKAFSPELLRLGSGYIEKVKTRTGVVAKGLRRQTEGGVIESILNFKNQRGSNNPSHPSHPSQNDSNVDKACFSGVMDSVMDGDGLKNPVVKGDGSLTDGDGLSTNPSPIHHTLQMDIQPLVQPFKKPPVTDVTDVMDYFNLREGEKNNYSIPDNLSLTKKILEAWDSPPVLGKIVLEADSYELRKEVKDYTPQKIAHLKEAANVAWKPGLNRDADYKGERVEILEAGQSRSIKIRTASGTTQVIKRGNLRPWLGI